jgi:hypothetical protein
MILSITGWGFDAILSNILQTTSFPSGIVRPLGFATKPDAGEPSRGPVEVDAFALHPRSSRLLFRQQNAPPLSVSSHGILEPLTPVTAARVVVQ